MAPIAILFHHQCVLTGGQRQTILAVGVRAGGQGRLGGNDQYRIDHWCAAATDNALDGGGGQGAQGKVGLRQCASQHRLTGEGAAVVTPGADREIIEPRRHGDRIGAATVAQAMKGRTIADTGHRGAGQRCIVALTPHETAQVASGEHPADRFVGIDPAIAIVIVRPGIAQINRRVGHKGF